MGAEFFVPGVESFFYRHELERLEVFEEMFLQRGGGGFGIVVCAAKRFGDDLIHKAEFFQMIGSNLEGLGRVGGGGTIFP